MYGENTKTIAIPIYRVLPYPVIHACSICPGNNYNHSCGSCVLCTGDLYYGLKWWKRVFLYLLDLTLVNTHILYKTATGSKITQLNFRIPVATSLLQGLEAPATTSCHVVQVSFGTLREHSQNLSQTRND